MQLIAVPFTPTYAEYIFLKGRRVLADQMEYLLAHFPRSSPLHDRMQRWLDVTTGRRDRLSAHVYLIDACSTSFAPTTRCCQTCATATATRRMRCSASRASSRTSSSRCDRSTSRSRSIRACANSFRNGIFPAYKANRERRRPTSSRQFELCRELCRHLGLAEFAIAEYEADDIIGTLRALARRRPAHGSSPATRIWRS